MRTPFFPGACSRSLSSTITTRPSIRVAVSGAGPAGLAVAGILVREAPGRFTIDVYERDSRERDQGSGWDIDKPGRRTLERAGVDFESISRPGSASLVAYLTYSDEPQLVLTVPPPFNRLISGNPETNRHAMREGLLKSLGNNAHVRFKCSAEDIRPNGSGATLLGAEGEVLGDYDLVIDASGVASCLRKHRIPGQDFRSWYTGLTMLYGVINDPETSLNPEVVRRLGQGSLMILGDTSDLQGGLYMHMQRFGAEKLDRRTTWGIMLPRLGISDLSNELGLPPSGRNLYGEQLQVVKDWVKKQMGDKWDQMYIECVDSVDHVAVRPLFMFPINPERANDMLPLCVIGDALHALPPFSGSGGNTALLDAGELATFLVNYANGTDKRDLIPALREMEGKMLARATETAIEAEGSRFMLIKYLGSPNFTKNFVLEQIFRGWGDDARKWSLKRFTIYSCFRLWMKYQKLVDYCMPPRSKNSEFVS